MNEYNYHHEISYNLKMLESALDDTIVKRYDDSGKVRDSIKVNFIFAPKSRVLQDIRGQPDTVKFPIIALSPKGMRRDNERVKNKLEDINFKQEDGSFLRLRKIPWNIDLEMSIMTKYQGDLEQIIQNFSLFFDPYLVYSWREPRTGFEVRSEVLWDGNVGLDLPIELANDKAFRPIATMNLTLKTWLYRSALTPAGKICKINVDQIYTDNFYCNYDTLATYTADHFSENTQLSGRPILRYVSPYFLKSGGDYSIKLQGYNFKDVDSVYVSASNGMYDLTNYDPLSTGEIGFKGLMIDDFTKTDNTITFNIPSPSGIGFVDIIAVNSCGFGKLTEDANRCNRVENPYPTDNPEHYSWCVYQYPYLNGLVVGEDHNTIDIDYSKQIVQVEDSPTLDKDAIIQKIKELMTLGEVSLDDLT